MNPIEDIYFLDGYRIEVRKTRYNPLARATQHSVQVFTRTGEFPITQGTSNSAKRSYTKYVALQALERLARVTLDWSTPIVEP